MAGVDSVASELAHLEQMRLPQELDGSCGRNRAPEALNQLEATDDVAAVQTFLAEYADSPATYRAYKKEVERLLLWTVVECKKPLSSLTRDDFSDYALFLENPQPASRWCGPKRGRRGIRYSSGWKPFVGPLSASARRTALVIINSMLNYLVQANYLQGNPLALMRQRHRVGKALKGSKRQILARSLDNDQWEALVETIESLPTETAYERASLERTRFLIALLHFLALRVGELTSHCMGDFVEHHGRWYFAVTGKGDKEAEIPVNSDMLEALERYRTFLELTPLPGPDDSLPLIGHIHEPGMALGARRVNQLLKSLVARAAERLDAEQPHKAANLRQASAHWFRHTSLSRQAAQGIPLTHLKANARHSKLDTTMLYLHADEEERHEALEKHGWR